MHSQDILHLFHKGVISSLDFHFAQFISRLSGDTSPELFSAAALVSKFTEDGHICLDLSALAGKPLLNEDDHGSIICPELSLWREILKRNTVVGKPGDYKPLILDDKSRLYLFRYWEYEKNSAEEIRKRVEHILEGIDFNLLAGGLERLFPKAPDRETDWQKVAAATAVLKRFSVISGGPGTGKTTTVVKILALLLEQAKDKKLRIALTAPTGKAAARLQEAIKRSKKNDLPCSENIVEAIPDEAVTIHRLLGSISDSPYFKFNKNRPLPIDVVVIDEVSMVSLALMAKLNDAVPPDARMILLGDKDQLSSVEPGAVLGDICDTGRGHQYSRPHILCLKKIIGSELPPQSPEEVNPGIQDSIVTLKKSFRFKKESGVGEVGEAVNNGDGDRAMSLLKSEKYPAVTWKNLPLPHDLLFSLQDNVLKGFGEYLKTQDPKEALSVFEQFRILCALREGPFGVSYVNFLVEQILKKENLISPEQSWYAGRPIMITRNDYSLRLFNGDIGIIRPDLETSHELRAFFPATDGTVRKFPLLRLPDHETVYALTVHKSQGSEFDEVLLILPDVQSKVLTRELLYTAITRAKKGVSIWGIERIFQTAVSTRVERTSGLRDALWER